MEIAHRQPDASSDSSGHYYGYYAMARRSEPTVSGDNYLFCPSDPIAHFTPWMTSRSKKLISASWQGTLPRNFWMTTQYNAYVLFLWCKQAPPSLNFESPCLLCYCKGHADSTCRVCQETRQDAMNIEPNQDGDSLCFTASSFLSFVKLQIGGRVWRNALIFLCPPKRRLPHW